MALSGYLTLVSSSFSFLCILPILLTCAPTMSIFACLLTTRLKGPAAFSQPKNSLAANHWPAW